MDRHLIHRGIPIGAQVEREEGQRDRIVRRVWTERVGDILVVRIANRTFTSCIEHGTYTRIGGAIEDRKGLGYALRTS